MGQTPAKYFPGPTPYGNSPDIGTIAQAKAAAPAPLNNFLPLNPQDPSQQQPAQSQQPQGAGQGQFANLGNLNRYFNLGSGGIRSRFDQ